MLPIAILLAILASFSVQLFLPAFDGWSLPWELFARACVQVAVLMCFLFTLKEDRRND